jgi:hypothetical protein
MMIVILTTKRTSFFFHVARAFPVSSQQSMCCRLGTQKIQAAATIATAACCSPQNAANMD